MKRLLSFILIAISFSIYSQNPGVFPYLKTKTLSFSGCGLGKPVTIKYPENQVKIIDKKLSDFDVDHPIFDNEAGRYDDVVMQIEIPTLSKNFYVIFSQGPSCDPHFSLYDIEEDEWVAYIPGGELYLPGGDKIYSVGHTNSYFKMRRKFQFVDGKFEEVEPQFYYVGLETKTLNPITLYTSKTMKEEIARLPADYEIEVLIAEKPIDYRSEWKYLIKTKLGLVGWTHISSGQLKSIDVKGIFYNGD